VSIRIVVKYLGPVLIVLGGILVFPFAAALLSRDGAYLGFLIPGLGAAAIGILLWRFFPVERRSLSRREGLALVTCTWMLGALVGALPYSLTGTLPTYVDSFFEAMSGFTTTGATVMKSIDSQPVSILLWRNFSQWIGGMGIITFFVALFPMLGIGAARLFEAEMPGPQPERLRARVVNTARVLWLLYVGASVLEFLLLVFLPEISIFDAANITFATMPTGGFLHLSQSIGAYADLPYVTTVVTIFMLVAGVNFSLYYYFIGSRNTRWRLDTFLKNPEFRLYVGIFAVASVFITLNLIRSAGMDIANALQHATFQVASIQTTTGFVTTDFDLWPSMSKGILLVLMLVGASAGSTGGALKVVRLLVVVKHSFRQVVAAFSPRAVMPLKLGGEPVPEAMVSAIIGMAGLYALTVIVGFGIMTALGLDATSAFSSVAATVGNVGPGFAAVGPMYEYSFLPEIGKLVLSVCMLVGRLEFVTVLALLMPAFWRWR
jgi:trk system potassium uptake protein TrkH